MYDYSLERLVYGPDSATLAGKTATARAPVEAKVWRSPFLSRDVTLTGDIFFFRGGKYFISISFPLDYMMISEVTSRQRIELADVLKEHVLAYKAKRFNVVLFLHDREASVVGLQDVLAAEGVSLEFASSGNHLGVIERGIRTVKNHTRCLILDQVKKFDQARRFDKFCIHWSRRMRNWFPNRKSVDLVSPATHFFGRELDLNLDLRAGWLDHVLAKADTDSTLLNTARPRMVNCFVVGASPSVVGGYLLFNVETKKIIVRTQFQLSPAPQDIMKIMKDMASEDEQSYDTDDIDDWTYHGKQLAEEDHVEDPLPDYAHRGSTTARERMMSVPILTTILVMLVSVLTSTFKTFVVSVVNKPSVVKDVTAFSMSNAGLSMMS